VQHVKAHDRQCSPSIDGIAVETRRDVELPAPRLVVEGQSRRTRAELGELSGDAIARLCHGTGAL
jgi:hypothetical protein